MNLCTLIVSSMKEVRVLKPQEKAKAEQRKQRLIDARNERLESMSEEARRTYEQHVSIPLRQGGQALPFIDRVFAKDYLVLCPINN